MNVTNFFDNQLQVILPELFILLSVSTLLLIGVQYSTSERDGYPVVVKPIAWMVILVTFLATLLVFNNSFNSALLIHDPATHLDKVVLNKIYILACSPISSMAMLNTSLIMGYRNIDIVMFLLSCLMLSSILFFGRNFIFSVMSKIGHIITKNIEKHFFGLPNLLLIIMKDFS